MKISKIQLPILINYGTVDCPDVDFHTITASDTCRIKFECSGDGRLLIIWGWDEIVSHWWQSQIIVNPTNVIVHYEQGGEDD